MLAKKFAAALAFGAFTFALNFYHSPLIQVAQAEIKTYTGVGKCVQGDLITIEQAKNYARLRAEINAKEQAGVYLRGYSKAQNFNLTENKIEVITNSIVNIVGDVQYKTETAMIGDSPVVRYIATLNANIDTDGISAYIRCEATEYNKNKILEILENHIVSETNELKDNLNRIDAMIEHYKLAPSQAKKDEIRAEFIKFESDLQATVKNTDGMQASLQGNYQEAINLYNEALELNPNYAWAYVNRGIAYYNLNQYSATIDDFNKAVEINPNLEEVYLSRGVIYCELKQYAKAIIDFNKAIEINPNDAYAYNNRGNAYYDLKQYEAAISDYNKAIEINPNDAYAYYNRGNTYKKLKNYGAAISDFNKAIQINPNDAKTYNNRGGIYNDLKQYDKAIADCNKAIQLNPNFAEAYYNRGNIYLDLGYYQSAILGYSKAIEFNPNYENAYINRGIVYALLNNLQQAIKDFSKAIELNPYATNAYHARGLCYRELGEKEKANADFAKAKELGYKE